VYVAEMRGGARRALTDTSKLAGLFSGGVPFLAVAKDGTSTSPRISPPNPLDFLLLVRMLSLGLLLFLLVVPLSGGNGSVMIESRITRTIHC
jgi:hypothetical protein